MAGSIVLLCGCAGTGFDDRDSGCSRRTSWSAAAGPVARADPVSLGLLQAWSWVDFEQDCLVHPQPRGRLLPAAMAGGTGSGLGEQVRVARITPVSGLTRLATAAPDRLAGCARNRSPVGALHRSCVGRSCGWIGGCWGWEPIEPRLEQLCQWVLKAEGKGEYGLRLPGGKFRPRLARSSAAAVWNLALFCRWRWAERGRSCPDLEKQTGPWNGVKRAKPPEELLTRRRWFGCWRH